MGTQQILLIVLSVIIVGVAIAVGITMFKNQAYNANQSAVASEVQNYAAQVIQWYKTPVSLGGSGKGDVTPTPALVASALGFLGAGETTTSESGSFKVLTANGTSVVIVGIGNEKKANHPRVTTTITLASDTIAAVVDSTPNQTTWTGDGS